MTTGIEQGTPQLDVLPQVSIGLFEGRDTESLLERILDAAQEFMCSDFASLQVLDDNRKPPTLRLLGHRNFSPEMAAFWATVSSDQTSTCALALRSGSREVISDVETNELIGAAGDIDAYRARGIRALQTTPLYSRDGRLIGMVSTHWARPYEPSELQLRVFDILAHQAADLIERIQREKDLKTQERQYRLLFDSIDEGYCTIDVIFDAKQQPVDYRFVSSNRAFAAQSGILDANGKLVSEIAPELEDFWFEIYGEVAQTAVARRFIAEAASLGRWFDVYAFPGDGDFAPYPVGVIFRDITELRQAQLLKDQFLAIASHELRNPIAAVHGIAQQLRRLEASGQLTEGRLHAYLERLLTTSSHLARLADELTDVSRLRQGALPLHIETVDMSALIRSAAESEEWAAERIEIDIAPDLRPADVDASRVRQILGNLIENALRYSPSSEPVRICAVEEADGVRIEVLDHGLGIPPDALEAIFEVFVRASNALDIPGLGVGLYVSRETATRHGGRLWAESAGEGSGTTMCLWLPYQPSAAS